MNNFSSPFGTYQMESMFFDHPVILLTQGLLTSSNRHIPITINDALRSILTSTDALISVSWVATPLQVGYVVTQKSYRGKDFLRDCVALRAKIKHNEALSIVCAIIQSRACINSFPEEFYIAVDFFRYDCIKVCRSGEQYEEKYSVELLSFDAIDNIPENMLVLRLY